MSEGFLRNVLDPRLSNGLLWDVLSPWLGDRSLRNILNVSLFNGGRLDNLDVLNWI